MGGMKTVHRKKNVQFLEGKDVPEIEESQLAILPQPNRWLLAKIFGVCSVFLVTFVILFV